MGIKPGAEATPGVAEGWVIILGVDVGFRNFGISADVRP